MLFEYYGNKQIFEYYTIRFSPNYNDNTSGLDVYMYIHCRKEHKLKSHTTILTF